jgi:hypothetical protein
VAGAAVATVVAAMAGADIDKSRGNHGENQFY